MSVKIKRFKNRINNLISSYNLEQLRDRITGSGSYSGGEAWRTMNKEVYIEFGDITLYFSYNTLIAFENQNSLFFYDYGTHTTRRHIYDIDSFWTKNTHEVKKRLLNIILLTNLLSKSYEEAKHNARWY